MHDAALQAWNNFVMYSDPASYAPGTPERAAALASLFMSLANNGGLFHFLEATYDFDARECGDALHAVGARQAASQLDEILRGLAIALPVTSQADRVAALLQHWDEDLDAFDDCLSAEADKELVVVLEQHVLAREAFYVRLRAH